MAEKKRITIKSFSEGMRELEKLMEGIESGREGLEDTLDKVERGLELVDALNSRLRQSELRIKQLKARSAKVLLTDNEADDE